MAPRKATMVYKFQKFAPVLPHRSPGLIKKQMMLKSYYAVFSVCCIVSVLCCRSVCRVKKATLLNPFQHHQGI